MAKKVVKKTTKSTTAKTLKSAKAKTTKPTKAKTTTKAPKKRTKQDFAIVKVKLDGMKADLMKRLTTLKEGGDYSSDRGPGDYLDEASRTQNREMNFVLNDRDRQELRAIDEAMQRINDGLYGVCEECTGPIEPKRLEALPFAVFCIACQEEREAQQKRL